MTADRDTGDDTRAAEIARDLERAVRAEGTGRLIEAVASLTAAVERMETSAAQADERLVVLETAADALRLPLVRGAAETAALPDSATITADMALTAPEGFHAIEYAPSGDAYRWTGANGDEFGFMLVVDRTEELGVELALWPQGPGMTPVPAVIHCTVDGVHHQATATEEKDGLYRLRLPVREGGTFTQIRFTTITDDTDAEGDGRVLGVPFRYLMVARDAEA